MMQEILVINPDELEEEDTDSFWEENPNWQDEPARKSNPMAKKAMRLAGKLRSEGMDASSALSLAWDEVRRKKSGGGNMLENPIKLSPIMMVIGALVIAVLIHRAASGKWIWQGLGNKPAITAAPRTRQLTAANIDPTAGMKFCDSTYSSTGEPLSSNLETVGTIFG